MYIYNRPVDPMETFDISKPIHHPFPLPAQLQRVKNLSGSTFHTSAKKRRSHSLVAEVGWYLSPHAPWDWGIIYLHFAKIYIW